MPIPAVTCGLDIVVDYSVSPRTQALSASATETPTSWRWDMLSVPPGSGANVGTCGDFVDGVAVVQNPNVIIDGGVDGGYCFQCRATNSDGTSNPAVDKRNGQQLVIVLTEVGQLWLPPDYGFDWGEKYLNKTLRRIAGLMSPADHLVIVDSVDTNPGTLVDKLLAGSGISLNDTGSQIEIISTGGGGGGPTPWFTWDELTIDQFNVVYGSKASGYLEVVGNSFPNPGFGGQNWLRIHLDCTSGSPYSLRDNSMWLTIDGAYSYFGNYVTFDMLAPGRDDFQVSFGVLASVDYWNLRALFAAVDVSDYNGPVPEQVVMGYIDEYNADGLVYWRGDATRWMNTDEYGSMFGVSNMLGGVHGGYYKSSNQLLHLRAGIEQTVVVEEFDYMGAPLGFLLGLSNAGGGGGGSADVYIRNIKAYPYDAAPSGGCFVAGTRVSTPSGFRAIETLKKGDLVNSFDPDTRSIVVSEVVDCFAHNNVRYGVLEIGSSSLRMSKEHPVYASSCYTQAGSLKPGERLLSDTLEERVLEKPWVDLGLLATVYNLRVSGKHNYFAEGILVHNK